VGFEGAGGAYQFQQGNNIVRLGAAMQRDLFQPGQVSGQRHRFRMARVINDRLVNRFRKLHPFRAFKLSEQAALYGRRELLHFLDSYFLS